MTPLVRGTKPQFVGLLIEAIDFLDANQIDFIHQLGGARNFGAGIVDCHLINPLYEERELKRVFDRGKANTNKMDEKDDQWAEEYRPAFVGALEEHIEGGDVYELGTVDHGVVVGYNGDHPVETAKSDLTRVGCHSKYGFGELRVKPVTPDETYVKKQREQPKLEH